MPILQTVAYASTTLDQALVHQAAAAHSTAWRHLTPFSMHERWTMQEPATWCCRHCYCRWCCYRCPCYYYSYRYHQHCFLPVQLLLLIPLSAWKKRNILLRWIHRNTVQSEPIWWHSVSGRFKRGHQNNKLAADVISPTNADSYSTKFFPYLHKKWFYEIVYINKIT